MDTELEEVGMEYERTEKRGCNFDKLVGELKADDLMSELDACNSECRNFKQEIDCRIEKEEEFNKTW